MMNLTIEGTVTKTPELKISAKGNNYFKCCVEVPVGKIVKKVYVTMFGDEAMQAAERITTPGYVVSISGEPNWRGWLDKNNNVQSTPEMVGRRFKVISAPQFEAPRAQAQQYPQPSFQQYSAPADQKAFADEDIPF